MKELDVFGDTVLAKSTSVIAGAAITSPIWLDHLSTWATALLPILGCIWLIVQVSSHIYLKFYKKGAPSNGENK